jgi:2-dehydro-3-deoxyphosphogluconate aldolase/(4S)-4-hydroxy-2-oxoglutarate aldolase
MNFFKEYSADPLIAVLVIDNIANAVPIAQALVDGGVTTLEVTLRTEDALNAIEQIATHVPHAKIGAGTVLGAAQFNEVKQAGGQFAVSPGFTATLAEAAINSNLPWLPGAVTASEIMQALEHGIKGLKFFPAEASGGVKALKSFTSVFPEVSFCPTGGIKADNMQQYLALANVTSVGGSWLVTKEIIAAKRWSLICENAKKALAN